MFSRIYNLNGKVVLITGASGGLGRELAFKFFTEGCRVIIAGRNLEKLEQTRQSIIIDAGNISTERRHTDIIACELDIGNADDNLSEKVDQVVKQIENSFGTTRLDVLVNNAGVSQRTDFAETSLSIHRNIFNVNYFGPIELSKLLLPNMLKSKAPILLNICSVQSWIAVPGRCSYSASKFALRAFSDSLRRELGKSLRIISVYPGYINTNIHTNALAADGLPIQNRIDASAKDTKGLQVTDVAAKILNCVISDNGTTDLMIYSDGFQRIAVFLSYFYPSLLNWYLLRMHIKSKKNN
ncbi:hypothetical protein GJ496_010600 [Pomphorhynchus laevis]|nr:hypothetical protein GJ496_010600 [Pomphorhynchus laevis]